MDTATETPAVLMLVTKGAGRLDLSSVGRESAHNPAEGPYYDEAFRRWAAPPSAEALAILAEYAAAEEDDPRWAAKQAEHRRRLEGDPEQMALYRLDGQGWTCLRGTRPQPDLDITPAALRDLHWARLPELLDGAPERACAEAREDHARMVRAATESTLPLLLLVSLGRHGDRTHLSAIAYSDDMPAARAWAEAHAARIRDRSELETDAETGWQCLGYALYRLDSGVWTRLWDTSSEPEIPPSKLRDLFYCDERCGEMLESAPETSIERLAALVRSMP